MIDYSLILSTNYPGAEWTLNGNSYDGLTWLSDSPKPTQEELDALWLETKKAFDNKQIDIKRNNAYIAEADPLFFKAQRGEGTMADWEAKVAEIKARYPKEQ